MAMTDRRRKEKRRKGKKLTLFDIVWAIEQWIAGETQTQIGKSLGYTSGSYVNSRIRLFVMHNLPKRANEKYEPSEMHTKPPARKLARLALEAYRERHRAASLSAATTPALARTDIIEIVPPGKRDAGLISHCHAFRQLEAEFTADDEVRSHRKLGWSLEQAEARREELDEVVDRLCRSRARTMAGIRARVWTLLHFTPELFEQPDASCYDIRLLTALLRDLRTVLKVDDA